MCYKVTKVGTGYKITKGTPDQDGNTTSGEHAKMLAHIKKVKQETPNLKQYAKDCPMTHEAEQPINPETDAGMSQEHRETYEGSKAVNPWAVCTSSVGRSDKDKYEDCVMKVKAKHKIKRD